MQHLQNNILQFYVNIQKYTLNNNIYITPHHHKKQMKLFNQCNEKTLLLLVKKTQKTWCLKSWGNLGSTEVLRNPGQKWMMLKDRVIRWGNFVWFRQQYTCATLYSVLIYVKAVKCNKIWVTIPLRNNIFIFQCLCSEFFEF